jgi:hypothetical protein
MSDPVYPLINGMRASWAEIEFRVAGKRTIGIQEISYAPSQDPQYVYGAGVAPIGRTRGQTKPEASMSLLKEEADLLINELAGAGAGAGLGFGEVAFDIIINYRLEALGPGQVRTDAVRGCRLIKPSQSYSQGSEGLSVKIDLHPMAVELNGKKISLR